MMRINFEQMFLDLEIRNTNHNSMAYKSYGVILKCNNDLNYYDGNRIIINKINFKDFKNDYINLNMKNIFIIKNNDTKELINKTDLFTNKVDHDKYYIMKKNLNINIKSKLNIELHFDKTNENIEKYIEAEKEVQMLEYNEIYKDYTLKSTVNNDNTTICIIKYQNNIIGLFYYFIDINVIESVYTFKEYRHNNIMGFAIQEFCNYYNINPYLYCGSDVVKFYEKIGFETVGKIDFITSINNEELYNLITNEFNN